MRTLAWTLALGACATRGDAVVLEGMTSSVQTHGVARARLAPPDDADLVLFYGGEQQGSMETCGCPKRPRGSLARAKAYVDAHRRADRTPYLVLNTGHWLDDMIDGDALRSDVLLGNQWMVDGLQEGGWSALNVSYHDIPGLEARGAPVPGAVSANVVPDDGGGIARAGVFDIDGLKVAVTGVTADGMSFLVPEHHTVVDPVEALKVVVPELDADLVVVLAFELSARAEEIAAIPGVDVLIEAQSYRQQWGPFHESGTVWVRSHYQTQRLGELRLKVEDGVVVAAVDRKIDLDDGIRDDRKLDRMAWKARKEIDAVQKEIFASW